ncbi:MAG: hypothetical protein ACI8QS_001888 [Planctomycetota bacterium]|jgi:hypothetical protein
MDVADYSEDADWTNAFGDRFQGREALRERLEFIFNLGFVMAGSSSNNEFSDVTFLAPDGGSSHPSSSCAPASRGMWRIVSHLISQAQEKR